MKKRFTIFFSQLIFLKYKDGVNFNRIKKNVDNYSKKIYQKRIKAFNYTLFEHSSSKSQGFTYNNSLGSNIAMCSIAKKENLYIEEFVEHYKNLGFKKIFLYDNNELGGENFSEVLGNYINNNFVEIKNYRGMLSPQKKAYNDCYVNNNINYDWIAFYDIDEFLYIINYTNINKFLSLPKFKKCSSILINWKYYGDNNNIYYEQKPVQYRFTQPFIFLKNKTYDKYFFSAAKSIVKGGLNLTWAHFPHFINDPMKCRADGTLVKEPFSPPQYSYAFIKHFTTKSTEEYIIKLFKGNVNYIYSLNLKDFFFWLNNYYFLFNKITRKKLSFIKKILKFNIFKYIKY